MPGADRNSEHDSFGDSPWIKKLVDYTARALETQKVRVIGVCFGHQIVARALGAKVGRNPDGWEAAVNDVQLSAKGKELFALDNLVGIPCFDDRMVADHVVENTPDASRHRL